MRLALIVSLSFPACAQAAARPAESRNWDLSLWVLGATGEENTNSLSEAQILAAGAFLGRTITPEMGKGWRRGSLEYGFDVFPLVLELAPKTVYGAAFEPLVLRWNSARHLGRVVPYIELAGGAMRTSSNLPAGDTSDFNFLARGGGGIQLPAGARHSVDIACRWWHISNANLGVRNPEFNGIQVGFGFHWFK